MRDKTVKDAMTPIEAVFMLDCNDSIDTHTRDQVGHTTHQIYIFLSVSITPQILLRGFSRVPVYAGQRDNVVGMLLVKRLIKLDPNVSIPIYKLEEASIPPPTCIASTPLYDLLNQFQTGKSMLSFCCIFPSLHAHTMPFEHKAISPWCTPMNQTREVERLVWL